jgi:hypothetical protein
MTFIFILSHLYLAYGKTLIPTIEATDEKKLRTASTYQDNSWLFLICPSSLVEYTSRYKTNAERRGAPLEGGMECVCW